VTSGGPGLGDRLALVADQVAGAEVPSWRRPEEPAQQAADPVFDDGDDDLDVPDFLK